MPWADLRYIVLHSTMNNDALASFLLMCNITMSILDAIFGYYTRGISIHSYDGHSSWPRERYMPAYVILVARVELDAWCMGDLQL